MQERVWELSAQRGGVEAIGGVVMHPREGVGADKGPGGTSSAQGARGERGVGKRGAGVRKIEGALKSQDKRDKGNPQAWPRGGHC